MRLVVHDAQLDTLGQCAPNILDRLANARSDLYGVGSELLDHPSADDLALEAMGEASTHGGGLTNVRNVTEKHGHIPADCDDRAPKIIDRLRAPQRSYGPLDRPLRDNAAGGIQIRFVDGVHHVIQTDAPHRHALRIQLDLKLPQVATETLHSRYSGNGEQAVAHFELGEIAQRHEVGCALIRFQRKLENLVQSAGQAGDQRRIGAGRQLVRDLRHPLRDKLPGPVVIGAGIELNRDLRHPKLGVGPHPSHVRQTRERHFERDRNGGLELLGSHGRVLRDHIEDGSRQVRKHVPPEVLKPERSDDGA